MALEELFNVNVVIWSVVGIVVLVAIRYFMSPSADANKKFQSSTKLKKKKTFQKPAVMSRYSREEVARHNTADDCWLIIDGNVYDVSTYVDEHPGADSILKNAGLDNTKGFHGEQHGDSAKALVEDFKIGTLA